LVFCNLKINIARTLPDLEKLEKEMLEEIIQRELKAGYVRPE
jgi:hypothetical protein